MALETSQRFARSYRIDPDGCWVWLFKSRNQSGNAMFSVCVGRSVPAHRYSYELVHGALPSDQYVYHTCARADCVNPAHLVIGAKADHRQRSADHAKQGGYHWLRYPSAAQRRRADRLLEWVAEKFPPLEQEIDLLREKIAKYGQRRAVPNIWRPEDFT